MRDNGGWESFQMLEIKKYPCNDKREAEAEEERCRVELKATLNSQKAFVAETEKEYNKKYYEEHREQRKEYLEKNKNKLAEQRKIHYEKKCAILKSNLVPEIPT